MECNRDEAVRAKEIAEKKFLAKDVKGAKKFALKAQNLYPELEGISQMLMTLEVYISAEDGKIHGESNWYGVLGVTPLADDETIRKQYRKLALILHPDKNRSIGAEGAFQLVSQAWSLLSDKSKKSAYDQRYGAVFQQRNHNKNKGPSPQPAQNGFYNFANSAAPVKASKGNNNVSKKNPSNIPHQSRKKERRTFWTVCHRCKMQYEYLRMYLNHNLLCPNCHEAYFAVEIEPPSTKICKASSQTFNSQQRKSTSQQGYDTSRNNNTSKQQNSFQWVPFSESTGAQSAVQAANMVQQAYEKVKRERQKAQAAARREERKNLASKRSMGAETSGPSDGAKRRKGVEDCGMNNKQKATNRPDLKQSSLQKCMIKPHMDIKQLLMGKAREEIHKKVNTRVSEIKVGGVVGEKVLENTKEKETAKVKDVEQMMVNVPDPDFHDFDKDRREKCFGENQVWAVYDDANGMPRHYAMIHNVISLNPFKVRMSWLSSANHGSWFLRGFSETCGEFGKGRLEICNSLDCFSHIVRFARQTSKNIGIFPTKGNVWALYRNWSPEWNELTEAEVIHKYDIVEVLEDYDEELGVIVIPLVKVAGFKAVFHQHFNPEEIRRIPKEEMSRFSHQVPSHLLTGREGPKSPKGCRELDPAALPLDILQVISKIEEIEFMEIDDDDDIEFVKAVDSDGITITNTVEGIS